jgi:hypothetical protein
VLVRVLELLRDTSAAAPDPLVARLGVHPDGDVRASAIRCRGRAFDARALRRMLWSDPQAAVRAAAFAELTRRQAIEPERGREILEALLAGGGGAAALPALARAAASLPPEQTRGWLAELATDADPAVRKALAEELARHPSESQLPALLALLADPEAREPARRALCALGRPARDALAAALGDPATPRSVRRHLPRSLSRFAPGDAIPLLTQALEVEADPRVAYKILRGLCRLRADWPAIPVAAGPIAAVAERSLRRAIELLAFQTALEPPQQADAILLRLLREEEERALEGVFRALHILDPEVGYRALHRAARAADARDAAAAREVLEHVVKEPLRAGLLPLLSPAPRRERLAAALAFHEPASAGALLVEATPDVLDACWAAMMHDADPVLAAVAGRARGGAPEAKRGRS